MFKNYLKMSWRNFQKHKFYTILNVFGLAFGIACCIIVFNYIFHELNYDNYHADVDQVYRIEFQRDSSIGEFYTNSVPAPLVNSLKQEIPQILQASLLIPPFENSEHVLVANELHTFYETDIYFADPEITEILKFEAISGDIWTALKEPLSLVITQSLANKYFGTEDPVGQILNIEIDYDYYCPVQREDYVVKAVIKDTPTNTHIPVKMLLSTASMRTHLPWLDTYWRDFHRKYLYLKLQPGTDTSALEPALSKLADQYHEIYKQMTGREFKSYRYYLQPITNIHTDAQLRNHIKPAANIQLMSIFLFVVIVVMLIGCMNFINVSVSIGLKNLKQIGIRKVIGAAKSHLITQFYLESFFITAVAFILSFAFIEFLLPVFNSITGINMDLISLFSLPMLLSMTGLFTVLVLITGGYHAFILTNFQPQNVLKGNFTPGTKGYLFQKILVFLQFCIIIILLASSITIHQQLNFMQHSSLGFDKDHKIVLTFKSNLDRLRRDAENIKLSFLANPNIKSASVSSGVPGDMTGGYYLTRQDFADAQPEWHQVITTDLDFIDQFGLEFVAGRKFTDYSDQETGYIINESGAKILGFSDPQEALGRELSAHYHGKVKKIIGVIKDFHFQGMQQQIKPLLLDIETSLYSKLTVTVEPNDLPATISFLQKTWQEEFPGTPFVYAFLDEYFDKQYKLEDQIGRMVSIVSLLGMFIASIGLLGLVSFYIAQRTREISIRKVFGSSVSAVISYYSYKFIKIILFTIIVAVPVSWKLISYWLQNYAYQVKVGVWPYAVACLFVLMISSLVVSLRCLKAASTNPVKALKYE